MFSEWTFSIERSGGGPCDYCVSALVPRIETRAIALARLQPLTLLLGQMPRKNCRSHIDASHSRQPLVKGERLVRYEVNAVMRQKQVLDT